MTVVRESVLPLPLWRRGKVRDVYAVGSEHLLLVASDRVSAFDVVMEEPVPDKGTVLTQVAAFWFRRLAHLGPTHFITADWTEIVDQVPLLAAHADDAAGRSTLVRRTDPIPFECVVRGYLSGSAWKEYSVTGTLAGEPLPADLLESAKLKSPIFSPATKAVSGHDENIPFSVMDRALGREAHLLRERSLSLYREASAHAESVGLILADTKFEFGRDTGGDLVLIDEILTPDSSRYWPMDSYHPGHAQPSYDKQPLRDYLDGLRRAGTWNGEAPPPPLPPDVIDAMAARYRSAYQLLTGHPLPTAW